MFGYARGRIMELRNEYLRQLPIMDNAALRVLWAGEDARLQQEAMLAGAGEDAALPYVPQAIEHTLLSTDSAENKHMADY